MLQFMIEPGDYGSPLGLLQDLQLLDRIRVKEQDRVGVQILEQIAYDALLGELVRIVRARVTQRIQVHRVQFDRVLLRFPLEGAHVRQQLVGRHERLAARRFQLPLVQVYLVRLAHIRQVNWCDGDVLVEAIALLAACRRANAGEISRRPAQGGHEWVFALQQLPLQ